MDILTAIKKYTEENKELPWDSGLLTSGLVCRGSNNRPYQGFNQFLTRMYVELGGYDSNIFLTFNAIKKLNGKVNSGATGYQILYSSFTWYDKDERKISPQPRSREEEIILASNGCLKKFSGYRSYIVFNLSQTDLKYEKIKKQDYENIVIIPSARAVVDNYKNRPEISHDTREPYYDLKSDIVKCPAIVSFKSSEFYYGALFHELVHSTGAPGRLARFKAEKLNIHDYAGEELVAEFGATIIMDSLGLLKVNYIENHAAYIKSWLKKLSEFERPGNALISAYNKAVRAVGYIKGEWADET